jgi:hypothetical protein
MAIVSFENDISQIDPDPHRNAAILGHVAVVFRHGALQAQGTLNCVDDAAELCQQAIAHELEDAPVVTSDLRFEELFPERPQTLECPRFVKLHEAAVSNHISRENGA